GSDPERRDAAPRARSPLRPGAVRPRAAAAGGRDQGLPRSPHELARPRASRTGHVLSGPDAGRTEEVLRSAAAARDVRDEIPQAPARAARAVPARTQAR